MRVEGRVKLTNIGPQHVPLPRPRNGPSMRPLPHVKLRTDCAFLCACSNRTRYRKVCGLQMRVDCWPLALELLGQQYIAPGIGQPQGASRAAHTREIMADTFCGAFAQHPRRCFESRQAGREVGASEWRWQLLGEVALADQRGCGEHRRIVMQPESIGLSDWIWSHRWREQSVEPGTSRATGVHRAIRECSCRRGAA